MLEEGALVCHLYRRFAKSCDEREFRMFEQWINRYVRNWSHCDGVSTWLIAASIANRPGLADRLAGWTKSKNRWKRRSAAVSLIQEAKQGRNTETIFHICDLLLEDADDMVQKGVGWLLKETYPKKPREVLDFLDGWRTRAPRLVLRLAAEKMTREGPALVACKRLKANGQSPYPLRLQLSQHFGRRFSSRWMPEIRRDLSQRFQYKAALRDARMRHFQLGCRNHAASVKQNIDIDIPRTLWSNAPAAHAAFYLPNAPQQLRSPHSAEQFFRVASDPSEVTTSGRVGRGPKRGLIGKRRCHCGVVAPSQTWKRSVRSEKNMRFNKGRRRIHEGCSRFVQRVEESPARPTRFESGAASPR